MTNGDRNLRLAAFILNIISMVALEWTLLPLAWIIPMTVMSWGIYKGTRANTVAFGVCNLLFVNTIFFLGGGCPSATKSGDRFRGISGVSRFLSRLYRRSGNVFPCCLSR